MDHIPDDRKNYFFPSSPTKSSQSSPLLSNLQIFQICLLSSFSLTCPSSGHSHLSPGLIPHSPNWSVFPIIAISNLFFTEKPEWIFLKCKPNCAKCSAPLLKPLKHSRDSPLPSGYCLGSSLGLLMYFAIGQPLIFLVSFYPFRYRFPYFMYNS